MTYRLRMRSDNDHIREFTFVLDSEGPKGWAFMRLIRIEDNIEVLPNQPLIAEYDAGDRDLWRARSFKVNGVRGYSLIGPFGNPGHNIDLETVG